jgi:SAM-dependent methyltransferase
MSPEIPPILCCPACRCATLEAHEDHLKCSSCRASYPVIDGVPRFAGETYVASFGRQWNRYDVARDEEDEAVFAVKTGVDPRSLEGKLVLDAGCGGGRYAHLLGRFGARVVGIDLSDAVRKAATLCEKMPNVAILQGDLLELPLADGAFDFAFSIGVMHHSPDPRRAFRQVAAKVKTGGTLAVWLYRRNTLPQELMNNALRLVTTRTPPRILEPLCAAAGILGSVPIVNRTLNKLVNFSNHPDWTLRVCDNFDWYAPRYQSHHTVAELRDWFAAEGFTDLATLPPARTGRLYRWAYEHDLIIGSGVNVAGTKQA